MSNLVLACLAIGIVADTAVVLALFYPRAKAHPAKEKTEEPAHD